MLRKIQRKYNKVNFYLKHISRCSRKFNQFPYSIYENNDMWKKHARKLNEKQIEFPGKLCIYVNVSHPYCVYVQLVAFMI